MDGAVAGEEDGDAVDSEVVVGAVVGAVEGALVGEEDSAVVDQQRGGGRSCGCGRGLGGRRCHV